MATTLVRPRGVEQRIEQSAYKFIEMPSAAYLVIQPPPNPVMLLPPSATATAQPPAGEAAQSIVDEIRERLYRGADVLSGGRAQGVRIDFDEHYGIVAEVVVDLPARRALELWLRLAEEFRGIAVVVVEWTGEDDVGEDELVEYLVKIANASGLEPVALPGFSAVEAVREARE
jgi:hypothetical protein